MVSILKNLIGYFVYATIIMLGFIKKKNDRVTHIMGIYMWFIIAFSNTAADYYAYEEMYYCAFEPRYGDHEYGYMAICKLCLRLGLSYTTFRCIIASIIVIISIKAVEQYADRKNHVLSMYLIFPFLGCASGLRQACANSIILYSVKYILNDGRKNTFKFLFCIILATLFHYSSLFFILLLYAKYRKSKNISMAIQCTIVGTITLIFAKTNILFILVSRFTNREKTIRWLQLHMNFSGLYIVSLFLFVLFLFILYQARVLIRIRDNSFFLSQSKLNYKQARTVSGCIILTLLAFVGALLNSVVFLRLVLVLIPIGYAVCADAFAVYNIDDVDRRNNCEIYKCGMIIFCILCALFVYGFWIGGDTLKTPVGNILFGG